MKKGEKKAIKNKKRRNCNKKLKYKKGGKW
jgi:hypothetical protein